MATKLDFALEDCLTRMALGELTAEECLSLYPDLSAELRPLLAAAHKLGALKDLVPRPQFRARNRALLVRHMQSHPRRNSAWGRSRVLAYAAGFAVLTLGFATAGTALAQDALPGDALYPWKLASERLWRSVQQDRVQADLTLAERRVNELHAIQGLPGLELIGIAEYARLLLELRADVGADPGQSDWVNEILLSHRQNLSAFFAASQAELPNPEELFGAIPPPENNKPDNGKDKNDSNLDLPLVVPLTPGKKDDEEGGNGKNSNESLLEKALDELLGLP